MLIHPLVLIYPVVLIHPPVLIHPAAIPHFPHCPTGAASSRGASCSGWQHPWGPVAPSPAHLSIHLSVCHPFAYSQPGTELRPGAASDGQETRSELQTQLRAYLCRAGLWHLSGSPHPQRGRIGSLFTQFVRPPSPCSRLLFPVSDRGRACRWLPSLLRTGTGGRSKDKN